MNEVNNIEEAKKLVIRYRNITKEMIESEVETKCYNCDYRDGCESVNDIYGASSCERINYDNIMNNITGFGRSSTCVLCKPINVNNLPCYGCIYYELASSLCNTGINEETYYAIEGASNIDALFTAVNKRADYLENLIKKYEEQK